MTQPIPTGSRLATPAPPAAPVPMPAGMTGPPPSALVGPRPGQAGFVGATSHDAPEAHDRPQHVRSGDRRRRKAPLGWLPWAALAALLLLLGIMAAAGALVGRSDDSSASSSSRAGGTAGGAAAGTGSLTADGNDLLAGGSALGRLKTLNGAAVVGRGVLVQSVVADEGFWVGSSASDRAFVYLTPQARAAQGESPFQVRAGQHVDLTGTVGILGPNGAGRLGVTDAEGARLLTSQKGYVLAKTVRLS